HLRLPALLPSPPRSPLFPYTTLFRSLLASEVQRRTACQRFERRFRRAVANLSGKRACRVPLEPSARETLIDIRTLTMRCVVDQHIDLSHLSRDSVDKRHLGTFDGQVCHKRPSVRE